MKWEITIIATIDATTIQHRIHFTITHTHRKKAKAGKRQKKISIFCYIHLRKKNGAHTTRFNFHLLKSYLSCFFHSVPLQFKTFIYTKFIYGWHKQRSNTFDTKIYSTSLFLHVQCDFGCFQWRRDFV